MSAQPAAWETELPSPRQGSTDRSYTLFRAALSGLSGLMSILEHFPRRCRRCPGLTYGRPFGPTSITGLFLIKVSAIGPLPLCNYGRFAVHHTSRGRSSQSLFASKFEANPVCFCFSRVSLSRFVGGEIPRLRHVSGAASKTNHLSELSSVSEAFFSASRFLLLGNPTRIRVIDVLPFLLLLTVQA